MLPLRKASRTPIVLSAVALSLACGLSANSAHATGMQGHIFMAQCAAEQVTDKRLRAVFDDYPLYLANGAFLVDSGYTNQADHDQGEIPHWEGFIQAYLELIQKKYAPPYDSPEASAHIATLMGMAAHGMTDSTFDTLIYARAEQVEPSDMDSFDTAMDIFLVADMPRYFIPDFAYDSAILSETFTAVNHPVPEESIQKAVSTARTGIAAVSNFLYVGADEYGMKYPWGRAHFLDSKTPGSYAFGAKVVMGYYRELLRRLDGDTSADGALIGTYPSDDYPLVTLDAARPDGKIILFFGEGLDRGTLPEDVVTVTGPAGTVIPTKTTVFRGDEWANVLIVTAQTPWEGGTTYEVVLSNGIQTLSGVSPTDDFAFTFTTCASPDANGDCPAPSGPAAGNGCPITEEMYKMRPEEGGGGAGGGGGSSTGTGGTGGSAGGSEDPSSSGGCGLSTDGIESPLALALAGILALLGYGRRRKRA